MIRTHRCDSCGGSGYQSVYSESWPVDAVGPCWVCRGSGCISDVMPASDALADAETLRPLLEIDTMEHYIGRGYSVVGTAVTCAHFAFDAIPGLRGEA